MKYQIEKDNKYSSKKLEISKGYERDFYMISFEFLFTITQIKKGRGKLLFTSATKSSLEKTSKTK